MAPRETGLHAPVVDRLFHAWLAKLTLGLSAAALMLAYADWAAHLAISPGKQLELLDKAVRKWSRFAVYAARAAARHEGGCCIEPLQPLPRPGLASLPYN